MHVRTGRVGGGAAASDSEFTRAASWAFGFGLRHEVPALPPDIRYEQIVAFPPRTIRTLGARELQI